MEEEKIVEEQEVFEEGTVEEEKVEEVKEEEVKEESRPVEVASTPVKTSSIDFKECGKSGLNAIKNIFCKPFDAIKEFVTDSNFITGIIMIVVAALSMGIYELATLKRMYDGNSYYKPEYLKEFFTTFGESLLQYALLAVFGYLLITVIFKGKATIKQMISAVGLSLSFVIVAYLASSILIFIDADVINYIISYIHIFADIYTYLILFVAIKEVGQIDKNKLFLATACMFVLAKMGMDIYLKIFK